MRKMRWIAIEINVMLSEEIDKAKRQVSTDAYQMSIGEIVSMYERGEIIIDPEFQRLFRWTDSQKSKLLESLLLGIPLPPIFVFERDDSSWELIDGLQRVSTILEFIGCLRDPSSGLRAPSILEATKYLPSLHNAVWERTSRITLVEISEQNPIAKSQQLAIRRARLGVEILKRPSDNLVKYDLFQRLNSGGTVANSQELRNCIMLMINQNFFRSVKGAAESPAFISVTNVTDDQAERQRHMELAVRFLVHTLVPYDGRLDVEEYIDDGIVKLANAGDGDDGASIISSTFDLLDAVAGADALRRFQNGSHTGKAGLIGLEGIAVGVAKNIKAILAKGSNESKEFVGERLKSFWAQNQVTSVSSSGMRGTTRIQKTIPFGEAWFRP